MRLPILSLTLLLAGCTAGIFGGPDTSNWQRGNTTDDQTSSDLQSCRRTAQARVDFEDRTQPAAGTDPTSQGDLLTNLQEYQADKRVKQLVHECMQALGYRPGGETAS